MANITWPQGLPVTLVLEGLTKQPRSNVIRTAMDAGPGKARRRYTAKTTRYSGRMILSPGQLETFEVFYSGILADGVLRFSFTDPVSLDAAEFRFAADYTVAAVDGLFEVAMELERL